jgi:CBS domain-containing protein
VRPDYPFGIALQQDDDAPLTGQFQRLNRIVPEDQELQVLPSSTLVREALTKMKQHRFSQMPVSHGIEIIGVFSYRSFSLAVLRFEDEQTNVLHLRVADCLENLPYKVLNDPFEDVIDDLDRWDAVVVGTPQKLEGIVSSIDVLRYLYGVTSPFVLIGEIELAVRALMTWSATISELEECFKRSLSSIYKEGKLPSMVDSLTFTDYASVIGNGDNWERHFKDTFGSTRANVRAKLTGIARIRNDLFHFRRQITVAEFEQLTHVRDWLLGRSQMTQPKQSQAKLEVT